MFDGFQSVLGSDETQRQEAVGLLSQATPDPEMRSTLMQCFRCTVSSIEDNLLLEDYCNFAFYCGFVSHSPESQADGKVSRRTALAIFEFGTRGQSKLPIHGFVTAIAHLQCAQQQSLHTSGTISPKTVTAALHQVLNLVKLYVLERTQCFPFPEIFYDNCSLLMRTMWKYSEGVELVFSQYAPNGVMDFEGYHRFCNEFSIFPHINMQTMSKIFEFSSRKFRPDRLNIDCFFECLARIACALLFTDTFSQYVTTVSKILNFFETTFSSAFTGIFKITLPTEVDPLPDPILEEVYPSHITSTTTRIALRGKFLGALGRGIWISHSLASTVLHITEVDEDSAVLDVTPLPLGAWDSCSISSRIDNEGIPVFLITYVHKVRICIGNTPEDLALKCITRSDLCTLSSDELSVTLSSATNEIIRKRFIEACGKVPYNQNFLYEKCWKYLCDTSQMNTIGNDNRVALGLNSSIIEGKSSREILAILFSSHAQARAGDSTGRGSLTLLKYCEILVRLALCSSPPIGEIDRAVRDILTYKPIPEVFGASDQPDSVNSLARTMMINTPAQQSSESKSLQQAIQQQRVLKSVLEKQQVDYRMLCESLQTSVARLKGLLEVVFPASESLGKQVQSKLPAGVSEKLITIYRGEILAACDSMSDFLTKNPGDAELITFERESMKNAVLNVLVDWDKSHHAKEDKSQPAPRARALPVRDDQADDAREQLANLTSLLAEKEASFAQLQEMYLSATSDKEEKYQENERLKLVISSQKTLINDSQTSLLSERSTAEQRQRTLQAEIDRLVRVQRQMEEFQRKRKEDLGKAAGSDFKSAMQSLDESGLRIKCFELHHQLNADAKLLEITKEAHEQVKKREATANEEIANLRAQILALSNEKRGVLQQMELLLETKGTKRKPSEQDAWNPEVFDFTAGGGAEKHGGKGRASLGNGRLAAAGKTATRKLSAITSIGQMRTAKGDGAKSDAAKSEMAKPDIPKTDSSRSPRGEHFAVTPTLRETHRGSIADASGQPKLDEVKIGVNQSDSVSEADIPVHGVTLQPLAKSTSITSDGASERGGNAEVKEVICAENSDFHPRLDETQAFNPKPAPIANNSLCMTSSPTSPKITSPTSPQLSTPKFISQEKADPVNGPIELSRKPMSESPGIPWANSEVINRSSFASSFDTSVNMDQTKEKRHGDEVMTGVGSRTSVDSISSAKVTSPLMQRPPGTIGGGKRHSRAHAVGEGPRVEPCAKCAQLSGALRSLHTWVRERLRFLRSSCFDISGTVRKHRETIERETRARIEALGEEESEYQRELMVQEHQKQLEQQQQQQKADLATLEETEERSDIPLKNSATTAVEEVTIPTASLQLPSSVSEVKKVLTSSPKGGANQCVPCVKSILPTPRRLASIHSKLAQLDEIMKRAIPTDELVTTQADYLMIEPEVVHCVSARIPLPTVGPKKADLIDLLKDKEKPPGSEDLSLSGVNWPGSAGRREMSSRGGGLKVCSGTHESTLDTLPLKVVPPTALGNEVEYRVVFRSSDGTVVSVDRDTYRGVSPARANNVDRRAPLSTFAQHLTIRETGAENNEGRGGAVSPIPRFSSKFDELLHLLVQESAFRSVASGSGTSIMTPFVASTELRNWSPKRPQTGSGVTDAANKIKASRLVVRPPMLPTASSAAVIGSNAVTSNRSARIKIDDSKLQHMREQARKAHSTVVKSEIAECTKQ
jgi:hypothetical protein